MHFENIAELTVAPFNYVNCCLPFERSAFWSRYFLIFDDLCVDGRMILKWIKEGQWQIVYCTPHVGLVVRFCEPWCSAAGGQVAWQPGRD
jgi:hypothetical protein